jgi:hypothetical protein
MADIDNLRSRLAAIKKKSKKKKEKEPDIDAERELARERNFERIQRSIETQPDY